MVSKPTFQKYRPHRSESVFGSAEQRELLNSHGSNMLAGHVQMPPRDVSQILSRGQ